MRDHTPQAGRPVLLLGEALVDDFVDGPVAGGAPLNVARGLAGLGLPAHLASRLNPGDAAGEMLHASMARFGLDESGVQRDAVHATGLVTVIEAGDGTHRFHIHEEAAWDHLEAGPVLDWIAAHRPRLVYFGSLARRHPVSRAAMRRILDACPRGASIRYLDLNLRPGSDNAELAEECLAAADWVKVNDEELARLADWFDLPRDAADETRSLIRAGRALMRRHRLQRLVVTRGAKGYLGFEGAEEERSPVRGAAVALTRCVDTVGAGDAFSAMLLAALLRGDGWARSLALANGMAAAMCGERGPVPAHAAFFEPWRAALAVPEQT